jgi:hypothetical protein
VNEVIGTVAAATGYVLRALLYLLGWVPAVAGPSLVLWGTWQICPPACYILGGLVVSVLTLQRANTRSVRK